MCATCEFEGKQWVASAVAEDGVRVGIRGDAADQLARIGLVQGRKLALVQQAVAVELAHQPQGSIVVRQLAGAGRQQQQQRAVFVRAHGVVQQLDAGGVEPLHVIQHQHHGRRGMRPCGDQLADCAEQLLPAAALSCGRAQQRGQLPRQLGADGMFRDAAERVDPRSIGSILLDLERAPGQHRGAGPRKLLSKLIHQPGLADSRRPRQQQAMGAALLACGFGQCGDFTEFRVAPDQGRADGGRRFGAPGGFRGGCPGLNLCGLQQLGSRLLAQLRQKAPGGLQLILRLAVTAGSNQQPHQLRLHRLAERIDVRQPARQGQGAIRVGLSAHALGQQAGVGAARGFALARDPAVEIRELGEFQSFQELATHMGEQSL